MKKLLVLCVLLLALAILLPVASYAQQPAPQWFIVFEEAVSPANQSRFLEVQMEAVDMWKKYSFEVPVYSYLNDENVFYWVIPIRNFASIDTLFQKMGQLSKKMEADGYDGNASFRDLSTTSSTVMMWVPELSYHYSGSLAQEPGMPYVEWMFVHLLSGHEKEAAEALGKFRAYFSDNRLDYSWDTFNVLLGNQTPLMIGMFRAEGPAVLKEKIGKIWTEHEEVGKLWNEVSRHAWKIENKTGWYNAQLSLLPTMTIAEPEE